MDGRDAEDQGSRIIKDLKKITMKQKLILPILGLIVLSVLSTSRADGPVIGRAAPFFRVESGDKKELTLDMIKGKLVLLFYEDKDSTLKNIAIKNDLRKLFNAQPDNKKSDIFRLLVIDCTGAFWPFKVIWRDKLIEHSRKEGFTLYGDWDGEMLKNYHLVEDDSNIIIIDQEGIVRYFYAGQLPTIEMEKLKSILKKTWLNLQGEEMEQD